MTLLIKFISDSSKPKLMSVKYINSMVLKIINNRTYSNALIAITSF